jgi:hypothetical protein
MLTEGEAPPQKTHALLCFHIIQVPSMLKEIVVEGDERQSLQQWFSG